MNVFFLFLKKQMSSCAMSIQFRNKSSCYLMHYFSVYSPFLIYKYGVMMKKETHSCGHDYLKSSLSPFNLTYLLCLVSFFSAVSLKSLHLCKTTYYFRFPFKKKHIIFVSIFSLIYFQEI